MLKITEATRENVKKMPSNTKSKLFVMALNGVTVPEYSPLYGVLKKLKDIKNDCAAKGFTDFQTHEALRRYIFED